MSEQLALLPRYLTAHLQLSLAALALGLLISLPLALWVVRRPRLEAPILGIASVLQTIPGLALLALMVPALTVLEVKEKLDREDPLRVIDVREPNEWDICHIDGAELIPLGQLPSNLNKLDSAEELVLYCRSGVRSAQAVQLLQQAGFRKVYNMTGGILAWSDEIDPSFPKY